MYAFVSCTHALHFPDKGDPEAGCCQVKIAFSLFSRSSMLTAFSVVFMYSTDNIAHPAGAFPSVVVNCLHSIFISSPWSCHMFLYIQEKLYLR